MRTDSQGQPFLSRLFSCFGTHSIQNVGFQGPTSQLPSSSQTQVPELGGTVSKSERHCVQRASASLGKQPQASGVQTRSIAAIVSCQDRIPPMAEKCAVEHASQAASLLHHTCPSSFDEQQSSSVNASVQRLLDVAPGDIPASQLQLTQPDQLISDVTNLSFISQTSCGAVFKGQWRGAVVAIKFIASPAGNEPSTHVQDEHTTLVSTNASSDEVQQQTRSTGMPAHDILYQAYAHPNLVAVYAVRSTLLTEAEVPAYITKLLNSPQPTAQVTTTTVAEPAEAPCMPQVAHACLFVPAALGTTLRAQPAPGHVHGASHGNNAVSSLTVKAEAPAVAATAVDAHGDTNNEMQQVHAHDAPVEDDSAASQHSVDPSHMCTCNPTSQHAQDAEQRAARQQLLSELHAHLGSIASYNSSEGFGNPYGEHSRSVLDVRHVAVAAAAQAGQRLTAIFTEFCDRGSLCPTLGKGLFRENTHWTMRIAHRALLRTATEIACGLAHLHVHGVAHGGLQPSNVLLSTSRMDRRGFIAKLNDYGIHRPPAAHQQDAGLVPLAAKALMSGPPQPNSQDAAIAYTPPEQLHAGVCFPCSTFNASSAFAVASAMPQTWGVSGGGCTSLIVPAGLTAVTVGAPSTYVDAGGQASSALTRRSDRWPVSMTSMCGDAWSFGMLLYEMATGIPPLSDMPAEAVKAGLSAGTLQPQWPPTLPLPEGLTDLCAHCWQHRLEDRPSLPTIIKELQKIEDILRSKLKPVLSARLHDGSHVSSHYLAQAMPGATLSHHQ